MAIEKSRGMNVRQLLSMLMALESQGATEVQFLRMDNEGNGVQAGADWVAPQPVNGIAYVSLMPEWDTASNEAMNAVEM